MLRERLAWAINHAAEAEAQNKPVPNAALDWVRRGAEMAAEAVAAWERTAAAVADARREPLGHPA